MKDVARCDSALARCGWRAGIVTDVTGRGQCPTLGMPKQREMPLFGACILRTVDKISKLLGTIHKCIRRHMAGLRGAARPQSVETDRPLHSDGPTAQLLSTMAARGGDGDICYVTSVCCAAAP
jgi:hypothetical protein